MEKILTIVIPTYNMENFLPKALTSLVVEEELMNILEVIVVNDGSKDSSLDIAYAFQKQYPQTFHVINKENGNYGSCVNRGLLEAKGKYIKILDADDSFDNAVFSQYLEKIKTLDVDVIFNDAKLVKPDGTEVAQWIVPVPKYRIYNFFSFPFFPEMYNPQIQISAESGTKRSIFRQKNKTKRSKKRLHTTLIKPEQKVNEDLCSGFIVS